MKKKRTPDDSCASKKREYVVPGTEKHEPPRIVRGSYDSYGSSGSHYWYPN